MGMPGIFVSYNGMELSPTPVVNYIHEQISFGYSWGYNTSISLDGLFTGITTTGAAISTLTGIFASQFGGLVVTDSSSNIIYNWTGITVNEINIDPSPYFSGSFVKYSIKLKSFDFPSGIIDPSNEYSFTQNEDGTVNCNHKISARGVRNLSGAFQNAVSFVQQFTGKEPFGNCLPFLVPSGSGILLSIAENINRADSIYSVNEVYKYLTGQSVPYTRVTALSINDSIDAEFRTIDYSVKFQGSPVYKNTQSIINSYLEYGMLADIQSDFGFNTSTWIKNSYSANIDSGASTIDIKVGYSSGANASGYFDYDVNGEQDFVNNLENWKLQGEFKCFGPLDYRLNQIQLFKQTNSSNGWRDYLTGIIQNSPIFITTHDSSKMFSPNLEVSVEDNLQLATLKLSIKMDAGYEPLGISDIKYTIDGTPSRWIYKLFPSANIEGDYVIQDLQAQSQANQKFTLVGKTYNQTTGTSLFNGYLNNMATTYVNSGTTNAITSFLIAQELTTGTYDISTSETWLGQDNGVSSGILGLQAVGTSSNTAPLRPSNYNFGY